jgi:hypothetical protein
MGEDAGRSHCKKRKGKQQNRMQGDLIARKEKGSNRIGCRGGVCEATKLDAEANNFIKKKF